MVVTPPNRLHPPLHLLVRSRILCLIPPSEQPWNNHKFSISLCKRLIAQTNLKSYSNGNPLPAQVHSIIHVCPTHSHKPCCFISSTTTTTALDYMVLENLTSKFSSPSILDLKVGTRQYGDDIPEEKKKKHMKTVAESTSSTLGVRICGMQVVP